MPIPPPSRSRLVPTLVAIPTLRSARLIVEESTLNSVPSIYRSPLILTIPVLSPTAAGSMIKFSGPAMVAVSVPPLEIETPMPVVSNFLELS